MVHYLYPLLVFSLALELTNAEDHWSWPSNDSNTRTKNDKRPNHFNVRSDVLQFQGSQKTSDKKREFLIERQGRYEVNEGTTKRPTFARPQNDEFSGEFGEGNQPNDGINQKFGAGGPNFLNGQFGPNPYGIKPGGFPGGPFQGVNGIGNGYYPIQNIGGGFGGLGINGAGGSGILVGPGGPTGIIGRPYSRFPYNGGPGYYPAGINYPHNGGFGNSVFGGQPGGFFNPAGYAPGGFIQQQLPFGPRPIGAFGGGPQFGPQFDQSRQATKKVEKRAY